MEIISQDIFQFIVCSFLLDVDKGNLCSVSKSYNNLVSDKIVWNNIEKIDYAINMLNNLLDYNYDLTSNNNNYKNMIIKNWFAAYFLERAPNEETKKGWKIIFQRFRTTHTLDILERNLGRIILRNFVSTADDIYMDLIADYDHPDDWNRLISGIYTEKERPGWSPVVSTTTTLQLLNEICRYATKLRLKILKIYDSIILNNGNLENINEDFIIHLKIPIKFY